MMEKKRGARFGFHGWLVNGELVADICKLPSRFNFEGVIRELS